MSPDERPDEPPGDARTRARSDDAPSAAAESGRKTSEPYASEAHSATAGGAPRFDAPLIPIAPKPRDAARVRFNQRWLLGLMLLSGVAFLVVVGSFFVEAVVAAVLVALTWRMNVALRARLGGRRSLAALLSCLVVIVGIVAPLVMAGAMVIDQAVSLYDGIRPQVPTFAAQLEARLQSLSAPALEGLLPESLQEQARPAIEELVAALEGIDWAQILSGVGQGAASLINTTGRGTVSLIFSLFIGLFAMYYLYRDGERLVQRLRYLSPLDAHYEDVIADRLAAISRGTLRGALIIGLVQGGLGALTLWIAGVPAPLLWGVVMVVLAVIPIIGVYIVLYPIALVQLLIGNVWQAAFIAIMTATVITTIDNVLRPRVVGQTAKMHDLITFFAILGGIGVFGVMGFVVGPIVAAVFLALLDIYGMEFRGQLEDAELHDGSGDESGDGQGDGTGAADGPGEVAR